MLALSVRFPAVALIAAGRKSIEVRSWPTHYRGELLIVSSRLTPAQAREALYAGVPSGTALCVVNLLDCRPFRRSDAKAAMCGHGPNLFAWCIELAYWTVAEPVRGRTKLYPVADELVRRARRAPAWLTR